ncbi:MAG: PfkB family carbohydrate kinase [Myxococcota bacterium]|nr:PfkB family carbohydrate kinase [Myxococcota bacterium]
MSSDAVLIWGEVLWDRFPDGDQLGGAPANVAWHFGQAGGWARLVTRVGDDADGRRAIEKLEQVVDTSLVQVDPERATGEVSVRLENGEPRYTLHADRAWERIACTDLVRAALDEAGVMIFGTLAQRTPDGLLAWREAVASTRATKVCDLNLRPTDQYAIAITEAIEAADILKINDRELAALHQWYGWRDPIAKLRERSKLIAVTHGAAGSTLYGEQTIEIPAFEAPRGGDNVGCGDAYLAILVLGLTSGWDLEHSGRAAAKWAAAVAGARGATPLFSEEQIEELLA